MFECPNQPSIMTITRLVLWKISFNYQSAIRTLSFLWKILCYRFETMTMEGMQYTSYVRYLSNILSKFKLKKAKFRYSICNYKIVDINKSDHMVYASFKSHQRWRSYGYLTWFYITMYNSSETITQRKILADPCTFLHA